MDYYIGGSARRGKVLPLSFYQRDDVVLIARELLGKVLVCKLQGEPVRGLITETEAYAGTSDRASHAYGGKYSKRTSVMYMAGGVAYIYLCYGMHHLFNVVTNMESKPDAVLIRSVFPIGNRPVDGFGQQLFNQLLQSGKGPGRVGRYFRFHHSMSGLSLLAGDVFLEDIGLYVDNEEIIVSARIGVDYAGLDASLPYRFQLSAEYLKKRLPFDDPIA